MLEVVLKDLLEVVLEDVGSGAIGSAKCGAGRCWKWCSGKLEAKDSLRLRLQSLYAYPRTHPPIPISYKYFMFSSFCSFSCFLVATKVHEIKNRSIIYWFRFRPSLVPVVIDSMRFK